MRLAGAISAAGGAHNEDGCGLIERSGVVSAAWVFDGVTGINARNCLPAASDAAWFVGEAQRWLQVLAALDLPLTQILSQLVDELIESWRIVSHGIDFPSDFEPPAACLLLAKRYDGGWQVLRLGDSILLRNDGITKLLPAPPSNLAALESMLRTEAARRRETGFLDFKELLAEFEPHLRENRRSRNNPGSYSILAADPKAKLFPQIADLGDPRSILLCSDGFFRAVDTYGFIDCETLMAECSRPGGVADVLARIRSVEAADPECRQHLRFKPADDATAVCLVAGDGA